MTFDEFLSDIKSSMEQYDSAGLIDDLSVYNLVIEGLNTFNMLPTRKMETVVSIKNNAGKLPDGFKSLYSAIKCEPYKCIIEPDENQGENMLQNFYQYKVRELKNTDWNFCNPCDMEETETCVVEKVYLYNNTRANFYYHNLSPIKLKLTPNVKRTKCDKECLNFSIYSSPHEISINNKTLYANFKEGNIFMVYNGYEEDEDGFLIIPETDEGNLDKYLKAYVKKKIIEKVLINSDNTTNEQFLYSIFERDENLYLAKAMGEMKLKRVLASMNNYKKRVKKEFSVYNFGNFSCNNHYTNKIEFIVV
jgi:hypothetical protein